MLTKVYNLSFTESCDGVVTHHSFTSIGGGVWSYVRSFISASGARTLTEVLNSDAMISQLKLLSFGVNKNTDVALSTTLLDTTCSKTLIKNDIIALTLDNIKIEILSDEKTFKIFTKNANRIIGKNAEELFKTLSEIS